MRLLIVANIDKPLVRPALEELVPWLKQRVEVVGVEESCDGDWSHLSADVILVLRVHREDDEVALLDLERLRDFETLSRLILYAILNKQLR